MQDTVRSESHAGGVVLIRMDRPPANALDTALVTAVAGALQGAVAGGARAIVLAGRPGMFSGGLDVPALLPRSPADIEAFWRAFFGLARSLATCAVPVVAAITGHAPAGGAVLALHCDWRIAAAGNFRIGLNEVQVGLPVPATILAALAHAVGPRVARRLSMRGELVPVAEAHALGLVDELVAPGEVEARSLAFASELTALPPIAMNTTRLNAKAEFLAALGGTDDAVAATAWWFSPETQAGMRKLVDRLRR